jgi:AcrR family transcriptional regulator
LYDQPTASELLGAVAGFLRDEVSPTLSGRLAFHARVAVNVLEMVRRELALGPAAVEGEASRLTALLGRDGPLAELEEALCEAIASGKANPDDPALIEHLWATTLDTLAVDQPNYATYRHAAAEKKTD